MFDDGVKWAEENTIEFTSMIKMLSEISKTAQVKNFMTKL